MYEPRQPPIHQSGSCLLASELSLEGPELDLRTLAEMPLERNAWSWAKRGPSQWACLVARPPSGGDTTGQCVIHGYWVFWGVFLNNQHGISKKKSKLVLLFKISINDRMLRENSYSGNYTIPATMQKWYVNMAKVWRMYRNIFTLRFRQMRDGIQGDILFKNLFMIVL